MYAHSAGRHIKEEKTLSSVRGTGETGKVVLTTAGERQSSSKREVRISRRETCWGRRRNQGVKSENRYSLSEKKPSP